MPDQTLQAEIRAEIYRAWADRKLLATVGSWGDTLEDGEVLELLKWWNDAPARKTYQVVLGQNRRTGGAMLLGSADFVNLPQL